MLRLEERKVKRARNEPSPAVDPADAKDNISSFLQSWAWKREHRPDRERFQRPYVHSLDLPQCGVLPDGGTFKLIIEQARFHGAQGFASTVWDSSIVVAKMLERSPGLVSGRAVLDLSAGCGLVAIVAALLGARRTVATDLAPNLPLLKRNCERNEAAVEVMEHLWGTDTTPLLSEREWGGRGRGGAGAGAGLGADALGAVATETPRMKTVTAAIAAVTAVTAPELDIAPAVSMTGALAVKQGGNGEKGRKEFGEQAAGRAGRGGGDGSSRPLDVIVACDVMYQEEAMGPLVQTLASLCGGKYDGNADARATGKGPFIASAAVATAAASDARCPTTVLLAHGRNRFAEAAFWRHAAAAGFKAEAITWDELDPVYRCTDVDVYRLALKGGGDVKT